MPTGAVRVDTNPASTGARAPWMIFAVVDAVVAALSRWWSSMLRLLGGERHVRDAPSELSGVVCTPMRQPVHNEPRSTRTSVAARGVQRAVACGAACACRFSLSALRSPLSALPSLTKTQA